MDHYDGSLQNFIRSSQRPQDQSHQIQKILYSTLLALDYIHNKGYIHLDLKPQNILVREKHNVIEVVLADFGLARVIKSYGSRDVDKDGRPGTGPYNGYPDTHYSKQVDIWALGLVAYYTVASIQSGQEITYSELVKLRDASKDFNGSFKSQLENQIDSHQHCFIRLIQDCLNPEPAQREPFSSSFPPPQDDVESKLNYVTKRVEDHGKKLDELDQKIEEKSYCDLL